MRAVRHEGRRAIATRYLAVVAAILFIGTAVTGYYVFAPAPKSSTTTSSSSILTIGSSTSTTCNSAAPAQDEQLSPTTFGAITEFNLSANRTPAAFAVAPDGSVWIGEWGLPGVAHLFPNGTLTEYKWPYPDTSAISVCGQETQIWGVALWNGTVWGADNIYSRLVSVNPVTSATSEISLPSGIFPYTLAVGDGDLWFTSNSPPGVIGRVLPNATVDYYSLPDNSSSLSQYIIFTNSTMGYVLTADPDSFTASLLSFDPASSDPTFTSINTSGTAALYAPSSITYGEGGIWATEHSSSSMAFLNLTTDQWTVYPTSTVPYVPTVLTYFDATNGSAVWFNEHYTNRMGELTDDGRYLTEYSVTDPPLFNLTTILENYNMVTMGLTTSGAWFAAATAGLVGFVNTSYVPPFSITANSTAISVAPGGSAEIGIRYTGDVSGSNLSLQYEDNENYTSVPSMLAFRQSAVTTTNGVSTFTLTVAASSSIKAGTYVAAATVDNGSIYQTVYFTVDVT